MDFSLFLRSSSAAPGHSAGHYMYQQGATLLSQGQTSNGKRIKRMTQMNEWRKKHKVRRLKSSIQHTLKFHNSMFNSPLLSIKQRPTQVHLLCVHLEHSNKSSCKYPQTPLQSSFTLPESAGPSSLSRSFEMKSSCGGSSHGDMGLFLYQQSLFLIKTFYCRSMSKHTQLKKIKRVGEIV